jgi:hypothetical protein
LWRCLLRTCVKTPAIVAEVSGALIYARPISSHFSIPFGFIQPELQTGPLNKQQTCKTNVNVNRSSDDNHQMCTTTCTIIRTPRF